MLLERKKNPLHIPFCWVDGGKFKIELDPSAEDNAEKGPVFGHIDEDDADADLFCAINRGVFFDIE